MNDYGSFATQPLPIRRAVRRSGEPVKLKGVGGQGGAGAGLVRSGGHVALAGVVSRLTGFARTLVVAAVLGTAAVGDAYNGANNLPNMLYELLLGSVLASAVVPVLARARRQGRKRSREFTQRVMVAAVVVLAGVTALTVACAPLIVRVFVADAEQRGLATWFAYLLLPQIFFYGVSVVVGAVLNVRDSFATAAWAPVVNNVIVLVTCAVFVLLPGPVTLTPTTMTTAQVLTIGVGTTAGIAGQAAWVVAALRRNGFAWSWRVRPLPYTWRPIRSGLPILGWLLVYAAISQIGVAITMRVAFDHGGVSIYTYAELLFQVPYGILAASVLTVLMPRISRAAALGDHAAVIADLSRGARYLSVALIPVTMAMSLLGPGFAALVFAGRVDAEAAGLIGTAVACSAFGLAPFALVMLQMRMFYAYHDTRTPTVINVVMVVTKVGVLVLSATMLTDHAVIVMLSVASSLAYVAGAVTGHLLLRRRHGLLGFSAVAATVHRVAWATVPAGAAGLAAIALIRTTVRAPDIEQLATLAAGAAVGTMVFLLAARVIGIPEIRAVRAMLVRS
ncbi:putative peptidoglycan lipid II flippase [Nocardia tenerifensis]|uniref:Putative peptidoglycan lipid II flippase n=1 Tax=Nocardia tenerifensis TaxID=228006 RepID=A0A318KF55_9NOCA|nr:murein biosynthesis integral membrane protein MurJ [Nocardia tenerifensis]PXX71585.1 putative peptidoglycan lipid II flippase [Nocardia tenerifensis]